MALAKGDKLSRHSPGFAEGSLFTSLKGEHGFGYDPLFVPDGHCQTFSQLGDDEKKKISHRAKALEGLKDFFAEVDYIDDSIPRHEEFTPHRGI